MKGLKSKKKEKFINYFILVQNTADKQDKTFFLDYEGGKDFYSKDEKMEGENLCGWLIPNDQTDEFEKEWFNNKVSDKWSDNLTWVEWKFVDGHIEVELIPTI